MELDEVHYTKPNDDRVYSTTINITVLEHIKQELLKKGYTYLGVLRISLRNTYFVKL